MLRIILAVVGAIISGIYLANPGWGFLLEIPDNLPGVGNLDEVFFSGLFFYCLSVLGINLIPHAKAKQAEDRSRLGK